MNSVQTLSETWAQLHTHRVALAHALAIPMAMLLLLGWALQAGVSEPAWPAVAFIGWYCLTSMAISTHRIVLLGPHSAPKWGVWVAPGGGRYVLAQVQCALVPGVLVAALVGLGNQAALWQDDDMIVFAAVGLVVPVAYLVGRLALVLPALATGQAWSLADSWRATRAHAQRMLVVVGVCANVANILGVWAVAGTPGQRLVCAALMVLTGVLFVAALSVAYRDISRPAPLQTA